MSIDTVPFVSIQPDWYKVIREVQDNTGADDSFWVSCYLTGKETVHGKVNVIFTKEYEVQLEGQDGIAVVFVNSRTLKVSCESLGIKDVVVYAPRREFYPVQGKSVSCIDVSPNGNFYVVGNGEEASVGSVSTGEVQVTLKGHLSDVTTVQFFPSNLVALTGSSDFQLKIWSVLNGSNPVTLKGHTSAITSTAIVSNGRNVLSSSRDGSVRLWSCRKSETIAKIASYNSPVNSMIIASLPSQFEPVSADQLDPEEVETGDKLILVALEDGSVRGIHLGSKKEIFSTPVKEEPTTAVAYESSTGTIITGSKNGTVEVYSVEKGLEEPILRWKRNGFSVTSIVSKTNEDGEIALCISNADGSAYQTLALKQLIETGHITSIEVEFTGSELETVQNLRAFTPEGESKSQRVAFAVRDGKVKFY